MPVDFIKKLDRVRVATHLCIKRSICHTLETTKDFALSLTCITFLSKGVWGEIFIITMSTALTDFEFMNQVHGIIMTCF